MTKRKRAKESVGINDKKRTEGESVGIDGTENAQWRSTNFTSVTLQV